MEMSQKYKQIVDTFNSNLPNHTKGEIGMITGTVGSGITILALLSAIDQAYVKGNKVLFCTYEMSSFRLHQKTLELMLYLGISREDAVSSGGTLNIYQDLSMSDIEEDLIAEEYDLMIVDGVMLMCLVEESTWESLRANTNTLKELTNKDLCTIITLPKSLKTSSRDTYFNNFCDFTVDTSTLGE